MLEVTSALTIDDLKKAALYKKRVSIHAVKGTVEYDYSFRPYSPPREQDEKKVYSCMGSLYLLVSDEQKGPEVSAEIWMYKPGSQKAKITLNIF